jgi:hypothetical protein
MNTAVSRLILLHRAKDAGDGNKCLTLHPQALNAHVAGALAFFPTSKRIDEIAEFEAEKTNFANLALLNTELYNDERFDVKLPNDVTPLLQQMADHSQAFSTESLVRKALSSGSFKNLADAVLRSRGADYRSYVLNSFKILAEQNDRTRGILADKVNTGKLDRMCRMSGCSDALDNVALAFFDVEKNYLATTISEAITTMPGYLSQMTKNDLKETLSSAVILAIGNLVIQTLDATVFDVAELSREEASNIYLIANQVAYKGFDVAAITDALVDEFQGSLGLARDLAVSKTRYALAQLITVAIENYEALRESATYVSGLGEGSSVPANFIPNSPDVQAALAAMSFETAKVPRWFSEIFQSLGSKAVVESQPEHLQTLRDLLTNILVLLRQEINAVKIDATPAALNSLKKTDNTLAKKKHYRWKTVDGKMRAIMKVATNQSVKNIMGSFLEINKLADALHAGSLRSMIEGIFDVMVTGELNEGAIAGNAKWIALGRDKVGLTHLDEQIVHAQDYLDTKRTLVSRLFSKDISVRAQILREELKDKQTFINYVTIKLKDLEKRVPILFARVPLWAEGQATTGSKEPVPFAELVIGLKRAVKVLGLGKALADSSAEYLNDEFFSKDVSFNSTNLATPIEGLGVVTPRMLAIYAAMGRKSADVDYWKIINGKVREWKFKYWDGKEPPVPPMRDEFWPEQFKVRDAIYAQPLFNKNQSSESRALCMAISSLLSAPIMSSALGAQQELAELLKPGTPTAKDLIAKTPIYSAILNLAGDEVGGGVKSIYNDSTSFERFQADLKQVTGRVHTFTHYMFLGSIFIKFSHADHGLLGHIMAITSAVDLAADVMLYADYWQSYSAISPYSFSNAMGGGLVSYDDADRIKDQIDMFTPQLLQRLPNDLWFFRDVTVGDARFVKNWIHNRKINATLSARKISRRKYDEEQFAVIKSYHEVGLRLGTSPEQFAQIYKKVREELEPRAKKKDQEAIDGLKAFSRVDKSLRKFNKRYPSLIKYVVGKKLGKPGFKDAKDFRIEDEIRQTQSGGL